MPEYGRVILKSTVPRDTLLTLHHLLAICQLDDRLRSLSEFHPICETWSHGHCCPSWSLPNYVALLSNRTSCHHITVSVCVCVCSFCTWTQSCTFSYIITCFLVNHLITCFLVNHLITCCTCLCVHSMRMWIRFTGCCGGVPVTLTCS